MINKDWYFKGDNYICNFRSAGVLLQNNKLLVQHEANGNEYALPGGHVKIGETAAESLIREYKEETGFDIICKRLLWTEESFWSWNKTRTSTIAFYYLIETVDRTGLPEDEFFSQKDNCSVLLGFMPLSKLKNITIYPSFIKDEIENINGCIKHFISKD
jgi:ADP-ribose pyrophosphatase YjhB (NUDIX family)